MKSQILIIFVLAVLSACDLQTIAELENKRVEPVELTSKDSSSNEFKILVYEDCEYLVYKVKMDENTAFEGMTHKGNCSNPLHQKIPNVE
jgi:hypothetical protein